MLSGTDEDEVTAAEGGARGVPPQPHVQQNKKPDTTWRSQGWVHSSSNQGKGGQDFGVAQEAEF